MAKRPEPWYWAARKGWYLQHNKKQILLGKAASKTTVPPKPVMAEYHRLMLAENLLDETDRLRATLPQVCEAFIHSKRKMRIETVRKYIQFLTRFAKHYARKRFNLIRIPDVEQWVESFDTWAPGTKHDAVRMIKTLFRWARDAGYCDINPLAGYENPYPVPQRERCMTDQEFTALIDAAKDLQFKQVMMFLRDTGCRPGEARVVAAAHIQHDKPIIILPKELHKTGRRTGKQRIIYLAKSVEPMVRALAVRYPIGPIFRNSRNGQGWGRTSIHTRVRKYRRKLGLQEDVVPYLSRHAFATRAIESGEDPVLIAQLMGHAGVRTLLNTYTHLTHGPALDAADRVSKRKKLKD